MVRVVRHFCVLALLAVGLVDVSSGQMQRQVSNEKGGSTDEAVGHPLAWWTDDPLRLDTTGDLMIGYPADSGVKLTAKSYDVEQTVVVLGTVNGNQITQVIDTIRGKPGIRLYGAPLSEGISQWKSLLVRPPGSDLYFEIYQLHAGLGTYQPLKSAALYGNGVDTMLGTYDPDSGNGGGCGDGYWWFDAAGAHSVDFQPVFAAMAKAAPPHSTFTEGCWAMHPDQARIKTWVQKYGAKCHACGGLGEAEARYVVRHGVAKPTSVAFTADPDQ